MVALIQAAAAEHASTVINYTQPIIAVATCCGALVSLYVALSIGRVKAEMQKEMAEMKLLVISTISSALDNYMRRDDCASTTLSQQHAIDEIRGDVKYIRNAITPIKAQSDA
jgi:hypothetical protein